MGARGTPATTAAARAGIEIVPHEYDVDHTAPDYGVAVAEAIGQDVGRVYKTLLVAVDGHGLAVAVVPVAERLDLKAVAAAHGGRRVAMADPAAAERATGYVVGGISPLGQRRRLPMVVDDSVGRHETVFVSGGRRGLQIEIAPSDLLELTGASVAPITRQH